MTEQQAVQAIHALPRMGTGKPTLERMHALLDTLGNPENKLKCIHIAGTNGKGTLSTMTASILTHAGYKTGLTISPYVLDFRRYAPEYDEEFKRRFYLGGHMNPAGYLLTAKMVASYIDYIIRRNPEDFSQTGFIGTPFHNVSAPW